jgi:uncharacterized protein YndB with AHSA1/START domain
MIEPLQLAFDVDCQPHEAFALWTEQTALWWPPSHTASKRKGTRIVFEPRTGGRVYERSPTGTEVDWGTILAWEPPRRLVYRWHLLSDPADATEVEVVFRPNANGVTTVMIEHRGWDAFEDGTERRDRNRVGWAQLINCYADACERS